MKFNVLLLCCFSLISFCAQTELDDVIQHLIQQAVRDELDQLKAEIKQRDERIEKIEQLVRIGTLRSCAEYARYGLESSGPFIIDPDGPLLGEKPFQAYCNFTSG